MGVKRQGDLHRGNHGTNDLRIPQNPTPTLFIKRRYRSDLLMKAVEVSPTQAKGIEKTVEPNQWRPEYEKW